MAESDRCWSEVLELLNRVARSRVAGRYGIQRSEIDDLVQSTAVNLLVLCSRCPEIYRALLRWPDRLRVVVHCTRLQCLQIARHRARSRSSYVRYVLQVESQVFKTEQPSAAAEVEMAEAIGRIHRQVESSGLREAFLPVSRDLKYLAQQQGCSLRTIQRKLNRLREEINGQDTSESDSDDRT